MIQKAIEIIGTQRKLAHLLGIHPVTVNQWCHGKRPVPAVWCSEIERLTNGEVTRKDLRPDDWHLYWPDLATDKEPAHA